MSEIRIAVAGAGNCAYALVQGIKYYENKENSDETVPGLMNNVVGGYKIHDINPVCAFDVDERKVGKDLGKALKEDPNCAKKFQEIPDEVDAPVYKGPILDGVSDHMLEYEDHKTFVPDQERNPVDVAEKLEEHNVDILINYLPVGSQEAVETYAEACLESDTAFVNCMPVFIASDEEWEEKFREKDIPVVGDDIKSQVGATIIHRALTQLLKDRGVRLNRTYQLNTGGNTDFLNMVERERLETKKISKTQAVNSILDEKLDSRDIHIGPSDYVEWQDDNKKAFIRLEGEEFGGVPVEIELQLSVEDSPNSAGSAIDAIRCAKLALDRDIGGSIDSISAYTMKHPRKQIPDEEAKREVKEFIEGQTKT